MESTILLRASRPVSAMPPVTSTPNPATSSTCLTHCDAVYATAAVPTFSAAVMIAARIVLISFLSFWSFEPVKRSGSTVDAFASFS